MTDLLEPWKPVDEQRRQTLENELERELPPSHIPALVGSAPPDRYRNGTAGHAIA